MVSPEDRFLRIVEDGMCIGCGLCRSLAGEDRVRMVVTPEGNERPAVAGALDEAIVDRIYATCPGTRLEGLPERLAAGAETDPVWGPWRRVVLGWAGDPEARHVGATGGALTALAAQLVAEGLAVLHARAHETHPPFGQATVSRTEADVLAAAGSRYGPTATLAHVHALLDRGERFAFIGTPCDVSALRNLAAIDDRVDRLVAVMLTMVCGGFMAPERMRAFLAGDLGLDPEEVAHVRYRGHGCPGPTRVETRDGRVFERSYAAFWGDDASQWRLPHRCKVCPDGIGDAADIAAADTWPGGGPDPATEADDPGVNALVIRSAAGMALVGRAVASGRLILGDEVDPRWMDGVQPHQRDRKLVVRARLDGMADEGLTVPRTARLRLDELAATLPEGVAAAQRAGTRRRVAEGKVRERRPAPYSE